MSELGLQANHEASPARQHGLLVNNCRAGACFSCSQAARIWCSTAPVGAREPVPRW
ncbi:hypothetical protein [Actinomadura macra]|uniref:hypothetical protein n=1 Tax=Actinomadura macra TaxID=46164 RepID=UPI0012FB0C04|nr:hypothetical protein [Actinomadura macra]